jgi:hypothetical protein
MFYIANQILKDDYLSEDAVEQTFVKIIENLDNISDVDCHKTKSYIVIMVRNCSIVSVKSASVSPKARRSETESWFGKSGRGSNPSALERTVELGEYIVQNKAPVRSAAKKFGVSKSTVHTVVT